MEPHFKQSLVSRNHQLDDLFSAKTFTMEEKKKKAKNDCEEGSEEEEGPCKSGYQLVERVGVCYAFLLWC